MKCDVCKDDYATEKLLRGGPAPRRWKVCFKCIHFFEDLAKVIRKGVREHGHKGIMFHNSNACFCEGTNGMHEAKCFMASLPKKEVEDNYWNGKCRTGCPTQDHKSYGECMKSARIGIDKISLKVKE